ncbi:hypothetical protein JJB07_22200 [Tumebacillus sp. ITR2]|uniref:G5 domain-containing protein n=1 Tax=Tumebacillus amylolyticus TaxID=2801339 RepID=A0ABS1JGE1_9BACL|nr:hypothetical protein [Tumebacillus amylolyticus]MBL0389307.1 hypothetical protein [Tumebacillus amylolyticus]
MKKAFAFVGLALAAALLVPATTQTADIQVAPSHAVQINRDIPISPVVSYIVRDGVVGGDETAYIVRGKKTGHGNEVQRDIPIMPPVDTAYIVREGKPPVDESVQTAYIVRDTPPPSDDSVQTAYIVRGKKTKNDVVVG